MKRYWLFLWDQYYPRGGLGNLRARYDTLDEVATELRNGVGWNYDYGMLYDLEKNEEFDLEREDERFVLPEYLTY